MASLVNRYEFLLFFDVADGNPNGDPDAGNLPRVDAETGNGLVSDVCLKRKVRNFIQIAKNLPGFDIFIKEKAVLNTLIDASHDAPEVKDKTMTPSQWMCRNYYDIRTFGAVMTTGKNAGQIRGPIQMTFARSVVPVIPLEHTITRMAVTNEKDIKNERTMGRKFTIPYGLYVARGFISPQLAEKTGFSQDDLDLFFEALKNMFEHDRSAARGMMSTRKLIVFKHGEALGSAPAWKLFDLVSARQIDESRPARAFEDFEITINRANCPKSVEILEML